MSEKLRKMLFYILIAANFFMVMIYEFLTPNMTDDIIYGDIVAKATNFFDLFAQEFEHYINHSGRNIAHIILRIFLYTGNKAIFNVAASVVFVLISILIYLNVFHRKKYDLRVYQAIVILMWLFDPAISNTVFWETGACNYLFTGAIMMTYITVFRILARDDNKSGARVVALMAILGLLSGWCNENSSGGVIFFSMLMLFTKFREKKDFKSVSPWMYAGLIGNLTGFAIMILSPGNGARAEGAEEEHTGIMAVMARFLKITLNIKDYYLVILLVFIVIAIAIFYRTGTFSKFVSSARGMLLFGLMFLATCYALIAVPESQLRTYYGAGLFLMTGIAAGFGFMVNEGFREDLVQIIATSLVAILSIIFVLTYVEEGANLARIKREFDERDAYLAEAAKGEEMVVEAPMLRPLWESRFSMAYVSDICEDKFNWINMTYSEHYKLDYVIGVDREEWDKY